jgi:hypothetical protein
MLFYTIRDSEIEMTYLGGEIWERERDMWRGRDMGMKI